MWVWGPTPAGCQSGNVVCKDCSVEDARRIQTLPWLELLAFAFAARWHLHRLPKNQAANNPMYSTEPVWALRKDGCLDYFCYWHGAVTDADERTFKLVADALGVA